MSNTTGKRIRNPSARLANVDNAGEVELQSHRDARQRSLAEEERRRQEAHRQTNSNLETPATSSYAASGSHTTPVSREASGTSLPTSVNPSTSDVQHEMDDVSFGKRALSTEEASEKPASIADTAGAGAGLCIPTLYIVLD
jgi:hypothetical protein